jgi:REP element-mobilizing transposase RayT
MADAFARVLVHVVWAVYDRAPTLMQSRDALLHDLLRAEAAKLRSTIVAVGNADDHVHALVDLHRTAALAALVQQLKGGSAHAWNVERHEPRLRWQSGYWTESVCAEHLDPVASYVRAQRHHHPASEPWQLCEASWEPPEGA